MDLSCVAIEETHMDAFSIGVTFAVVMAVAARLTRFDSDRSHYATILIVIASYYVLLAFIAKEAILPEILVATLFSAIAILGVYQ